MRASGSRALVLAAASLAVPIANGTMRAEAASPGPVPSASPAATVAAHGSAADAVALYDAAVARWRALPVRPFVSYETDFVVRARGKTLERRYAIDYRRSDGLCNIRGVPLDARDRPDKVEIDDHCLADDFAFTLIPQRTGGVATGGIAPVPVPTAAPSGGLAQIASVTAVARPYAIAYAGDETVDGVVTAHLALRPYGSAHRVLRDLWIDRATGGVVRLAGEFESGANVARIAFTARYAESAGEQRLLDVSGYAKAQILFARIGADLAYAQGRYVYPASLPDWLFDAKAYGAHGPLPAATPYAGGSANAPPPAPVPSHAT